MVPVKIDIKMNDDRGTAPAETEGFVCWIVGLFKRMLQQIKGRTEVT